MRNLEQIWENWKRYFLWEESREDILLDHRLTSLYYEIREWEAKYGPKLPEDFTIRLESTLESVPRVETNKENHWLGKFFHNPKLQYGLAFTTASLVVAITLGRIFSPNHESIPDTAGVIIDNSSYLNQSSYVEYADSFHRRILIDKLKKDANSLEALHDLERYYLATGRNGLASEIRFIIQEIEE